MHPFISTMANMLVIFGLVTYATKGVSFGAIEPTIPNMVIPKVNGFPTIILWAVAAIVIVWFIWNKTTFGKNLYAVGGNPEAAAVSGISVFAVTLGAFIMAGILYGFGSWLECTEWLDLVPPLMDRAGIWMPLQPVLSVVYHLPVVLVRFPVLLPVYVSLQH